MPAFRLLKDKDIEALVDYVIYLSARGETERALLAELAYEHNDVPDLSQAVGSSEVQESILSNDSPIQAAEIPVAKNSSGEDLAVLQFIKWEVKQPAEPQRPGSFPLWEQTDPAGNQVERDEASLNSIAALNDSIARGKELFGGQVASCFRCHGTLGEGGVLVRDYDDWTKDWTVAVGLNPEDRESLSPYLRAGAFKPTPISSRDLRHGVFRGGGSPEDIYRRIVHGIEGTPMPAAAMQPEISAGLTTEQVWDLVNYCLSFQGNDLESGY